MNTQRHIICTMLAILCAPIGYAQGIRSATVDFTRCRTTYGQDSMRVVTTNLPYYRQGCVVTQTGNQVSVINNIEGCDSIVTTHYEVVPPGSVYPFSVAANKQVYFSSGNLQFIAMLNGTDLLQHPVDYRKNMTDWILFVQGQYRFALHQWDMIGLTMFNKTNTTYTTRTLPMDTARWGQYAGGMCTAVLTTAEWVDLFGNGYLPWRYSPLTTARYDWTHDGISNGGNVPGIWRTLTSAEWQYLAKQRPNAANLVAYATVNEIQGLVILPDAWVCPDACQVKCNILEYTANSYTSQGEVNNWTQMEQAGAVFLPAVSFIGTATETPGSIPITYYSFPQEGEGYYATQTTGEQYFMFNTEQYGMAPFTVYPTSRTFINFKSAVRLVRDIK